MQRAGYAERKIPLTIALSPQAHSYVSREARLMQVSIPDMIRRMIDREIERARRSELARDQSKLRIPGSG